MDGGGEIQYPKLSKIVFVVTVWVDIIFIAKVCFGNEDRPDHDKVKWNNEWCANKQVNFSTTITIEYSQKDCHQLCVFG